MHAPPELHVLVVIVPASEPVVAQPPPTCTQVPPQTVLVPHTTPVGLKVQAREVAVVPVTMHWPAEVQVLV